MATGGNVIAVGASGRASALPGRPEKARLFEKSYRIGVGDADPSGTVRLDAIARFLQDVALDMIHETDFLDRDPFWIVRRNVIDVIEPLTWPGDVHVERWCSATSSRWVGMRQRLAGTPTCSPFNPGARPAGLIETESFCINVTRDGVPSRISDLTQAAWGGGVTDTRLRWNAMNPPVPPQDDTVASDVFVLRDSDFDFFAHMNNVAYWPAVQRQLEQHPEVTAGPHRAVIEYLRPVRPSDELEIRRAPHGDGIAVWFLCDDLVTTTATIRPL